MNAVGAEIFSAWLGEQVGKAVIDGGRQHSRVETEHEMAE
jgi:hypothetical protein